MTAYGRNISRLVALSPMIWGLAFLAIGIHHFVGVPVNWGWDNFTYLEAAKMRVPFVGLGFGRVPFCLLGWFFEWFSEATHGDVLFGGFRAWVITGLLFQTLMLCLLGKILPRHVGLVASHVALAFFATHTQTILFFLGVWPENWSMIALLATFAVLLGLANEKKAALLSLPLAVLVILFKEVSIYYVPALSLIVFLRLLQRSSLKASLCWSAFYGSGSALLGYGFLKIMQWVLPGLAESQQKWLHIHFGQQSVGLANFDKNFPAIWGTYEAYYVMQFLCLMACARLLFAIFSKDPEDRRFKASFLTAFTLIAVPGAVILLTGNTSALGRYSICLAPGFALLAASLFIDFRLPHLLLRRMPGFPSASLSKSLVVEVGAAFAAFIVCLSLYWNSDFDTLNYFYHENDSDKTRYKAMERMRDVPLAIIGGSDCWPAHYISRHSGGSARKTQWAIYWPKWGAHTNAIPPREWIDQALASGKTLAISSTAADRADIPVKQLLSQMAPLKFRQRETGWYLSEKP